MYEITLIVHNVLRWVVLVLLLLAILDSLKGILSNSLTRPNTILAKSVMHATSLQLVIGAVLYLIPGSVANMAIRNMGNAMKTTELRFFAVEHTFMMLLAIGMIHLGLARSRKAQTVKTSNRWALSCYLLAGILMLFAIPWWRPLFRMLG